MTRPRSQARRMFDLFGGVTKLQRALKRAGRPRDRVTLHRWDMPREKGGHGGAVPTRAMVDIAAAARLEGILLPSEAFDPRPM